MPEPCPNLCRVRGEGGGIVDDVSLRGKTTIKPSSYNIIPYKLVRLGFEQPLSFRFADGRFPTKPLHITKPFFYRHTLFLPADFFVTQAFFFTTRTVFYYKIVSLRRLFSFPPDTSFTTVLVVKILHSFFGQV